MDDLAGPLSGVRVLDFTRVLSGPHATRMLADMGADVIKVEPPDGDLTRFSFPRRNSLATYFVQQNSGKRNISLDLTRPAAVDIARLLAAGCDVVVENFRGGVMDRLGLGDDVLRARNPRLIYASITGYGSTGRWAHRRAYAAVVHAETGLTKTQGDERGGVYANDPHSHADVYTGMECAAAILAALYQRERTGVGQRIDVSMAQTMLYVNEHAHDQLWEGQRNDGEVRSFQPGAYPVLTAANGDVVVVSGHPADRGTFELFATAIGLPRLAEEDERFVDVSSRLVHLGELEALIAGWAATMADADAIEEHFARFRLATGRLRSLADLAATEWARERGAIADVPDRGGGSIRIPNPPWRFDAAATTTRGEPRYRGEDNAAVLEELLGISGTRVAQMEEDGVLSARLPRSAPH